MKFLKNSEDESQITEVPEYDFALDAKMSTADPGCVVHICIIGKRKIRCIHYVLDHVIWEEEDRLRMEQSAKFWPVDQFSNKDALGDFNSPEQIGQTEFQAL